MRIVVGLSGGVDSSVAALVLKQQGHEVIGMFMKNWHDTSVTKSTECPWIDDSNDAMLVAQQLGIPFQTIDLSEAYKARIVDYMFDEYSKGRTPNPDVLCNREIKFDLFLKAALQINADAVATGHYARVAHEGGTFRLLSGVDEGKDQSYFLCQLAQDQLAKAIFPLGEMTKKQVRELAAKEGLATAQKKDSQGLCFVGKVYLPDFLQQQLKPKQGDVVLVPPEAPVFHKDHAGSENHHQFEAYRLTPTAGTIIGQHQGAHFYTYGQRKGLHIGGSEKPLFVIGTDTTSNLIYVGMGVDHPGLFREGLFIRTEETHWVRPDRMLQPGDQKSYQFRIRYRQPLQEGQLLCTHEGLYISFKEPQRSITPGQFAVWYDGDELLGSGTIDQ